MVGGGDDSLFLACGVVWEEGGRVTSRSSRSRGSLWEILLVDLVSSSFFVSAYPSPSSPDQKRKITLSRKGCEDVETKRQLGTNRTASKNNEEIGKNITHTPRILRLRHLVLGRTG